MKLLPRLSKSIPPLAWYGNVVEETVAVEHGSCVEVGDQWIVEGVWDAPFMNGDFHRAEAFWGSGVRITQHGVEVVPSVSVTDRILYVRTSDGWAFSNSLPLLLARNGLHLRPGETYIAESYALSEGVFAYNSAIPVMGAVNEIRQLFHLNLVLNDGEEAQHCARSSIRHFEDFSSYVEAVTETMDRIRQNVFASQRKHPLLPVATISSGYDSACAAVFAKQVGAKIAFTKERSNSGFPTFFNRHATLDSGRQVAEALGLEIAPLPHMPSHREIYYRSASCIRPELALDGISAHLGGKTGVVFTGFYGDTFWGRSGNPDTTLAWPSPSGFSVSEGRLAGNYINVATPFLFGRSRPSIAAISNSEEMRRWSVGGDYDRPIPRRILEEAGAPRSAFGHSKKAILNHETAPVNRELRRQYYEWLGASCGVSPRSYRRRERITSILFVLIAFIRVVARLVGVRMKRTPREALWPSDCQPISLMFQWAVATIAERYKTSPPTSGRVNA